MDAMDSAAGPRNAGEPDAAAVREQLDRLLRHPLFCHSKRYPGLLRFVVEQTLEGHADQLKERLIGIEVFGRAPDYDANADPVVRVTAGETRKRLAQYYYDPEHSGELRIELPTGAYLPQFVWPAVDGGEAATEAGSADAATDGAANGVGISPGAAMLAAGGMAAGVASGGLPPGNPPVHHGMHLPWEHDDGRRGGRRHHCGEGSQNTHRVFRHSVRLAGGLRAADE